MSAVLVYLDRKSNQVIRVNHNIRVTPANLDETYFVYQDTDRMPQDIVAEKSWNKLEYAFHLGKFKISSSSVNPDDIKKLDSLIDCIEKIQGMINRLRTSALSNSMVGAQDIDQLYFEEIENYKFSGNIGPILTSKIDDDTTVEEVIAEYEIKKDSYKDMLIRTETLLNKYLPKIKKSQNPYAVLAEIQDKFGLNFGLNK